MAATKLQMNWNAVSFTPSGGSLTAMTKIDSISIDLGGTLEKYSGDADIYNTTITNSMNDPTISVDTSNIAQVIALPIGTTGSFTATHLDAKGATGGNIVYTLANAVVSTGTGQGAHAKIGSATLSLAAFSSDGVTSPLTFTRT